MRGIEKVAWVVCDDVSYQNFLKRFARCRGYYPLPFFQLSECQSMLFRSPTFPDLIIVGETRIEESNLEVIRTMNEQQEIIRFPLTSLMALAQSEVSRDINQGTRRSECGSRVRLTNLLKLIDLMKK